MQKKKPPQESEVTFTLSYYPCRNETSSGPGPRPFHPLDENENIAFKGTQPVIGVG